MTTPIVTEVPITHGPRMVVGTLVTGFYVIHAGAPERVSPVFSSRSSALGWLATANGNLPR